MKFSIAIEPGTEKTAYGVAVPDIPGCFSAGDTNDEAYDNAKEAIEGMCETMAEDGLALPIPKPLSAWQGDPEYAGWVWGIIEAQVEKFFGPAEKINITVPALVLSRIDDFVRANGQNRSAFLTQAALEMIAQKTGRPA